MFEEIKQLTDEELAEIAEVSYLHNFENAKLLLGHIGYLIGEVERLKGIEEHAIKRIKAETQENSRWIAFVEHLQNISLCSMTKNEIRQALNTFADRS